MKLILTIFSKKNYMGAVMSLTLAIQAFGRSLNTSVCEIYYHKAAFLLVETVMHKISISIYGKNVPIL